MGAGAVRPNPVPYSVTISPGRAGLSAVTEAPRVLAQQSVEVSPFDVTDAPELFVPLYVTPLADVPSVLPMRITRSHCPPG